MCRSKTQANATVFTTGDTERCSYSECAGPTLTQTPRRMDSHTLVGIEAKTLRFLASWRLISESEVAFTCEHFFANAFRSQAIPRMVNKILTPPYRFSLAALFRNPQSAIRNSPPGHPSDSPLLIDSQSEIRNSKFSTRSPVRSPFLYFCLISRVARARSAFHSGDDGGVNSSPV